MIKSQIKELESTLRKMEQDYPASNPQHDGTYSFDLLAAEQYHQLEQRYLEVCAEYRRQREAAAAAEKTPLLKRKK